MNTPMRSLVRMTLAVTVAVGTVLVCEGAYSLWTGESLLSLLLDRKLGVPVGMGGGGAARVRDQDLIDAGALTVGPYVMDLDPVVGMTMKRSSRQVLEGVAAHTDRFGQRRRPGPEPEEGALRVVLLGDSVAFGHGIADNQTLGHRLEQFLARVTAVDRPRPVVMTVSCPGWNTRNEARYLLNHVGQLRPDVVILLPVENDLDDQYPTNEFGARPSFGYDPALGPERPRIGNASRLSLYQQVGRLTPRGEQLRRQVHGNLQNSVAFVGETNLTPESRRRWDETGAILKNLEARLSARGCRLMVALRSQNSFESMFEELVRERLPDVPVRTLFVEYVAEDTLEFDSHPNPRYAWAGAWCMVEELLEQAWVPGGDRAALPALGFSYADRRAPDRSLAELRALIDERQAIWADFIESKIDLDTAIGFHQVYGGIGSGRLVGRHVLVALANNGGTRLRLDIERLPEASGVYPLSLSLRIDGEVGPAHPVPPPAEGEDAAFRLTFEVPATARDREFLDLQIDSSNWCIGTLGDRSELAAYEFVALELIP